MAAVPAAATMTMVATMVAELAALFLGGAS